MAEATALAELARLFAEMRRRTEAEERRDWFAPLLPLPDSLGDVLDRCSSSGVLP
jgi:hypothetical protein